MKKRIITATVAIAIALVLLCVSTIQIIRIQREYNRAQEEYTEIKHEFIRENEAWPYLDIDHITLRHRNSHYIGWINIADTSISYPMVQAADNDYYLRRSFDGEYLRAGSIFLDYRSSGSFSQTNTVIYGHHMKDGSMFAGLKEYMDEPYANEHKTIEIYTPDHMLLYEIFSVYQTHTSSDCFTFGFGSDQQRAEWVERMAGHSKFDLGVEVSGDDKIITLVTCIGGNPEDRYVVQAVLKEVVPYGE